ncbi:MAG: hypothetical protein SGJ00_06535 [bacterium]|nr:hypothetical protein [bacterium]
MNNFLNNTIKNTRFKSDLAISPYENLTLGTDFFKITGNSPYLHNNNNMPNLKDPLGNFVKGKYHSILNLRPDLLPLKTSKNIDLSSTIHFNTHHNLCPSFGNLNMHSGSILQLPNNTINKLTSNNSLIFNLGSTFSSNLLLGGLNSTFPIPTTEWFYRTTFNKWPITSNLGGLSCDSLKNIGLSTDEYKESLSFLCNPDINVKQYFTKTDTYNPFGKLLNNNGFVLGLTSPSLNFAHNRVGESSLLFKTPSTEYITAATLKATSIGDWAAGNSTINYLTNINKEVLKERAVTEKGIIDRALRKFGKSNYQLGEIERGSYEDEGKTIYVTIINILSISGDNIQVGDNNKQYLN